MKTRRVPLVQITVVGSVGYCALYGLDAEGKVWKAEDVGTDLGPWTLCQYQPEDLEDDHEE